MIGEQIGPYSILNLIGRGDIGAVYLAVHSSSEQQVAVKVLSPELSANPAMRNRILSQANRQAGLFHPNIVNVLKYLKDSRGIYLIMEVVPGESLENRLLRTGVLDLREALRISLKVLEAMAFMHRRGIRHCHLKPSDILITGDGNIKVMDFGIAKVFGEKGISVTGMRLESLWYMPPEQLRGEAVEAPSDIYSLGIILYQILTGEVPFHGQSRFEVMKAHMEEMPQDPATMAPKLPRGVCDLILKALAKAPQERFQSAEEMARALVQFTEAGEADAVFAFEGPPPVREAEAAGPESFPREGDDPPIPPEEELPFPDPFDRKLLFLLIGTGVVLTGLLVHVLFPGDTRKEDHIETRIPANVAPVERIPAPPAAPAPSKEETAASEASPTPEAAVDDAPAGIDPRLLVAPPFPHEPFDPWEAGIPKQTKPAPVSPARPEFGIHQEAAPPEALDGERPAGPDAASEKADAPRRKRRPPSQAQPKRSAGQSENRRSGKDSAPPPERENRGWRIIK